jgi:hypothetical protein
MSLRNCDCPHGFPICACCEGVRGQRLLDRSRYLSSLAGWPALVDEAAAVAVLAAFGRPASDPDAPAAYPWPALAQMEPLPRQAGGCGCSG